MMPSALETASKIVTIQTECPEDIDGILDEIRRILLLGSIQSLTLKIGEPITYQRYLRKGEEIDPSEGPQSYAGLSPMDVIRNAHIEEFDPTDLPNGEIDKAGTILWMMHLLELEGWSATHLFVATGTKFWDWIEIPRRMAKKLAQFGGMRVVRTEDLPVDVFLICGAKHRNATVAELGYALKSTTEMIYAGANQKGHRGGNSTPAEHRADEDVEDGAGGHSSK